MGASLHPRVLQRAAPVPAAGRAQPQEEEAAARQHQAASPQPPAVLQSAALSELLNVTIYFHTSLIMDLMNKHGIVTNKCLLLLLCHSIPPVPCSGDLSFKRMFAKILQNGEGFLQVETTSTLMTR